MVHALEIVRSLLRPGGALIDIHPSGNPAVIEVWTKPETQVLGHLRESDDFIEYGQAEAAVAEAVARGWFAVEQAGSFEFTYRADSVADLQAYLAAEWSDAILDDAIAAQAAGLLTPSGAELVMREQIRIARLKPRWSSDPAP